MGYTKIVQYGDVVEVRSYQKKYVYKKGGEIKRARSRQRTRGRFIRSQRSNKRAKVNFERIVMANLTSEKVVTFLTLTFLETFTEPEAKTALTAFFRRLKRRYENLRYIAVQEYQKRGAIHFHCLLWGVPSRATQAERATRNIQRLWARGYIDIRRSYDNDGKIAGYLSKYFTKSLEDNRNQARGKRLFFCSRNIYRPATAGSNSIDDDFVLTHLLSTEHYLSRESSYDTKWLGRCRLSVYKTHQ